MAKYTYNEQLIRDLGYYNLIEKYELSNNILNEAIFNAVAAVDSHLKNIQNINAENILLGDYFSFEYYDLLNNDLENLKKLTEILEENYSLLALDEIYGNNILYLALSLSTLLLSLHNRELLVEDAKILVNNFFNKYKSELSFIAKEESRLSNLLLHLELLYAR